MDILPRCSLCLGEDPLKLGNYQLRTNVVIIEGQRHSALNQLHPFRIFWAFPQASCDKLGSIDMNITNAQWSCGSVC